MFQLELVLLLDVLDERGSWRSRQQQGQVEFLLVVVLGLHDLRNRRHHLPLRSFAIHHLRRWSRACESRRHRKQRRRR